MEYAGSVRISKSQKYQFLLPVFKKKDSYFIQKIENDFIQDWRQIEKPEKDKLVFDGENIEVLKDKNAIYSYITPEETKIGCKEDLEPFLLKILDEHEINIHAKLSICNFLNLFGKSMNLLEAANEDIRRRGINESINPNVPFKNRINLPEGRKNLIEDISNRLERLQKMSKSVDIADVAIIKERRCYFSKYQFSIKEVINKEVAQDDLKDKVANSIIEKSSELFNTDIFHQIEKDDNNEVYNYFLLSKYSQLEQSKVEALFTTRPKVSTKKSIIEVSLKTDNLVHVKRVNTEEGEFPEREESLKESISEIVSNFQKKDL